ncbi:MAG: hypothetical protein M1820_004811 [Bogoriella megaspora]|nr:MAG: hypothetical protein M1820_004811 [Bogoriella megaspora]
MSFSAAATDGPFLRVLAVEGVQEQSPLPVTPLSGTPFRAFISYRWSITLSIEERTSEGIKKKSMSGDFGLGREAGRKVSSLGAIGEEKKKAMKEREKGVTDDHAESSVKEKVG